MFDDSIHFLANHLEAPDWRRLGEHLLSSGSNKRSNVPRQPVFAIDGCLPAEQGVWLMIVLALYRHKSISEVLDDLGLALPDAQTPFVSKSAASQGRQRVGPESLKWLFEHSVQHCPYGTNEMLYAKQLIAGIPNESLTVFDKGFVSAEILCTLKRR